MAFKLLRKIDQRTKYSVYGWIRDKEKILKLGNVPSMIKSICILYFRKEEIFDVISYKGIQLSENGKSITAKSDIDGPDNNNYGAMEIESESNTFYKWEFKVTGNKCDWIGFGISSKQIPNDFHEKDFKCIYYIIRNDAGKLRRSSHRRRSCYDSYSDTSFKTGDLISLHLNLKKRKMELMVNGKQRGIAFTNIETSQDIAYRMFVSLNKSDVTVEIMDFTKE